MLRVYRSLYSPLFEIFETHTALFVLAKFLLSLTILFLPAFFMGGTLPVLSQYFIRGPLEMGKTGSLLYTINTAGAILGSLCAGFLMLGQLGLWSSLKVIYLLHPALAFLTAILAGTGMRRHLAWAVGGLALFLHFSTQGDRYPLVYLGAEGNQELVAVIEGSHSRQRSLPL